MENSDPFREVLGIGQKFLDDGNYTAAEETFRQALAMRPDRTEAYYRLGKLLRAQGRRWEVVDLLDQALRRYPEMAFFRNPDFTERQAEAIARGLPAMFINTQYKSGSAFIRQIFADGLEIPACYLGAPEVSDDAVPSWTEQFARGGAITQMHMPAQHQQNIETLANSGIKKLVVHVRNPLQSLISHLHFNPYREEIIIHNDQEIKKNILIDKEKENWISDEIDAQIDEFIIHTSRWIDNWIDIESNRPYGIEVMITNYDDFRRDLRKFAISILDFFAIPHEKFNFNTLNIDRKTSRFHYREGRSDEWREVMTPKQIARARELMPQNLDKRFNWEVHQ